MEASRIKNPDLAAQIDEGELAWHRYITPITEHYARQIAQRDYRGKRLAYWGHITRQNTISMMLALKQAGAEIVIGACNVDSTDDVAAAYAVSQGIPVYGWQGMSQSEYQENLAMVRSFEADYLCDMGGELCSAYLDKTPPVKGALEATTSGLHLLKKHRLPFPVFDWNSIPLKDLHNRFHVGDSVWPAFSHVTGLGLFGRRVLGRRIWACRQRNCRASARSGSNCAMFLIWILCASWKHVILGVKRLAWRRAWPLPYHRDRHRGRRSLARRASWPGKAWSHSFQCRPLQSRN